ncbi:MAG: deoxyribodipyrimidine photolyase [Myxococcales bacterium]|nr:deoxyribodipyrimidine photolyase [Myxococcales bacterium]
MSLPSLRLRAVNDLAVRPDGAYVLYWMIAQRRTRWNFALQYAADQARALGRPLLVFEPLRVGYRWASRRLHAFVIDGMRDQRAACAAAGVAYLPYVEPAAGAGSGLLAALAAEACLVVTDEYPCFFLPQMVAAAGRRLPARLEAVDGNGLLPLRASDRAFPPAAGFRRHLQATLPPHLELFPAADPLASVSGPPAVVPPAILARWPAADLDDPGLLDHLPIDQTVRETLRGGATTAEARLDDFLVDGLPRYGELRSHPDADAASGLSPWLHFGHLSPHAIVDRIFAAEGWHPGRLGKVTGSRAGWWGLSATAESFLDELVTWREVGFGFCFHRPDDYFTFDSLPDWARATLTEHAVDPRPVLYDRETLAAARTHDPLWNAAQTELVRTGRMQNYLRMLWGKKVLEWSRTPAEALDTLIELNNRYAIDGRDPNSYSGIFWTLGRFDRPWGPVRPIFGTIRYMSSENTARKLKLAGYLARFGVDQPRLL